MKVVALVSGGKDSCYSIALCQKHGHEVVALANLLPAAEETDDLDSYMYQTVGHQLVGAYAACTGLPLFRRRIAGGSRQQGLVYTDTPGDEVEDLYCLLAAVQARLPGLQAVASGAIASDYQRTRVERVCARLGLVSLAYLWHQPQARLLRGMIDEPIDAILVKIAAAGLAPGRHLGARLAALPAELHTLRRRYGINVCGEGGEYETLVLDCPLFRHGRICLDAWESVLVQPDSLAPVALLHPTAFHVEPRGPADGAGSGAGAAGAGVGEGYVEEIPMAFAPPAVESRGPPEQGDFPSVGVKLLTTETPQHVTLVSAVLRHPGTPAAVDLSTAEGTSAALLAALQRLHCTLPGLGLGWEAALFVHLYLPSMAQFGAANEVYSRFLPVINPPSRATVQLAEDSVALAVEVVFARRPEGRSVLHVQSISEWAPSCIGPYSQATSHGGLVHFAGQIALDPATMGIVPGGIDAQCARCLISCQRVAVAVRTDLQQSMLWSTVYCSDAAGSAGAQRAQHHVEAFLRDGLPRECGAGGRGSARERGEPIEAPSPWETPESSDGEGGDDDQLDSYLVPPAMHRHWQPLLAFLAVPELPRGVLVEVQPVACALDSVPASASSSSSSSSSDDGGGDAPARPPGSTMPGWAGQLRASEGRLFVAAANGLAPELRCQSLVAPGRLCKMLISIPRLAAGPCTDEELLQAMAGAYALSMEPMQRAQLSATDVAVCKAYTAPGPSGPRCSAGDLHVAMASSFGNRWPQAAVVPVSAAGLDAGLDAWTLLEFTALAA